MGIFGICFIKDIENQHEKKLEYHCYHKWYLSLWNVKKLGRDIHWKSALRYTKWLIEKKKKKIILKKNFWEYFFDLKGLYVTMLEITYFCIKIV